MKQYDLNKSTHSQAHVKYHPFLCNLTDVSSIKAALNPMILFILKAKRKWTFVDKTAL